MESVKKPLSLWRRTLANLWSPRLAGGLPGFHFRKLKVECLEGRYAPAIVSLGPLGLHVGEGGTATLQATLDQYSMEEVTIYYETVEGTAIHNIDYLGVSGSVTIPPTALTANISIQALDDIMEEEGETFSLLLTGASGATINPQANSQVVTIDDLDSGGGSGTSGALTVNLSLPANVNEGEAFTMTGQIDAGGSYMVSGTINWGVSPGEGTSTFSVQTSPSGTFSVAYQYFDDGPNPGNGTSQDVQTITLTGTAVPMDPGGAELTVSGSTSTTIRNVNPNPVFDVFNYMPIGGPGQSAGRSRTSASPTSGRSGSTGEMGPRIR